MWGADATHVDLMDAGGSGAGSEASYGDRGIKSSRVFVLLFAIEFLTLDGLVHWCS